MSRHSTSAYLLGFVTPCASPLLLTACITSSGTGNPDSLGSLAMTNTAQAITGTTGFKYIGSLLSILSINIIDATIASTTNPLDTTLRLHNATSSTYPPYSTCKDNGCGTVYNVGSAVCWSSTTSLGILDLLNATDGSLPLYLRIAARVTLPTSTYTDTVGLNWARHLYTASIDPVCVYDDGTTSSSIDITLMVLKDCFIDSAPDSGFGNAVLVSALTTMNQNIGVRRTLNATYTIGFDNGSNFSGG